MITNRQLTAIAIMASLFLCAMWYLSWQGVKFLAANYVCAASADQQAPRTCHITLRKL